MYIHMYMCNCISHYELIEGGYSRLQYISHFSLTHTDVMLSQRLSDVCKRLEMPNDVCIHGYIHTGIFMRFKYPWCIHIYIHTCIVVYSYILKCINAYIHKGLYAYKYLHVHTDVLTYMLCSRRYYKITWIVDISYALVYNHIPSKSYSFHLCRHTSFIQR